MQFDFDVFDDGGGWYSLPHGVTIYAPETIESSTALISDSFEAVDGDVEVENYDVTMIVHAGKEKMNSLQSDRIHSFAAKTFDPSTLAIVVAEGSALGAYAHELGHVLEPLTTGSSTLLPDLYRRGDVHAWGLMATGSNNQGGVNPSSLTSYSRERLGWLQYANYAVDNYPSSLWVPVLSSLSQGDSITKLNLNAGWDEYYLLESRTRDDDASDWDTSLPGLGDDHLLVYYVNENTETVTIIGNNQLANVNDGIRNPSIGERYLDFKNLLEIAAVESAYAQGVKRIRAEISEIDADWLVENLSDSGVGAILDPFGVLSSAALLIRPDGQVSLGSEEEGTLIFEAVAQVRPSGYVYGLAIFEMLLVLIALAGLLWVKSNDIPLRICKVRLPLRRIVTINLALIVCVAVTYGVAGYMAKQDGFQAHGFRMVWPFTSIRYAPNIDLQDIPDLDLHVYCADGRHVGTNYSTGEYEVQIADILTNGDNVGAPEWIFFPPTPENASCKHSVSAHDNEAFLAANPEIAATLPDTTDRYEIYARYIDPATGIHTSETLADQSITPGASVVHEISGTTEVVLAAGVPDTAAPVTTISKSGTAGANGWYSSFVTITLSAIDGADGTGVHDTKYSLDSGVTWLPYSAPFVIADVGSHPVLFASTDNAGNVEAANSESVMIDSVAPAVTITGPLSGTVIGVTPTSVFGMLVEATSGVSIVSVNGMGCTFSEPDGLAFACGGVPLAEGENLLEVTATDFAGNAAQASVTVTLDTAAPAVTGSVITPVGTGSSSVELSVHATDATGAETAVASFVGPSPSTATVGSLTLVRSTGTAGDGEWTGRFDFPPVSEAPDGIYAVSVVVTDSVGNAHDEAVGTVNLDRTGSDIAAATATPQVQRPGAPVTIALSAKDASSGIATVTVRDATLGGASHVMTLIDGSSAPGEFGSWAYDLTAALPEGLHVLEVSVTDNSGNVATQPLEFTVDATAPDALIDAAPGGTSGANATVSFHATEDAEFSCKLDAGEWEPCESPTTLAGLLNGSHTFRVRATDIAGNVGATASGSWVTDAIAPIVTIDVVPPAESTATSATVTFHADDASASFECVLDAGDWESCASPKAYQSLAIGTHVIGVRATDVAGNVGERKNAQFSVLGTMTFHAVSDTFLRNGVPNQNNGAESYLRIKASGDNRALVRFDVAAIAAAIGQGSTVVGADLHLAITTNGNNWGSSGKTIDIHRMTSPWTEAGATWQCGNDTDLGNAKPDCPSGSWDMRKNADANPWSVQPTATALVTNGLSGAVPFDVTSDLVAFMAGAENDGWLVRKTDENHQGLVEFGSRESGTSQPELVVTYRVE